MAEDGDRSGAPWHAGERQVQERLGLGRAMDPIGSRNIRDFMPDQHRLFFAQLPFAMAAALDRGGWPWATVIAGPPGFIDSPDPRLLLIRAFPAEGDPVSDGLVPGAQVALLGIELPTRRRNRANGRVAAVDPAGFAVAVEQSFGNCPQYIQRREYGERRRGLYPAAEAVALDDALEEAWAGRVIRAADTAFVASSTGPGRPEPGGGMDVSHRGGRPGFIAIAADGALEIPDYRGNRYFNTLGNIVAYPRAGLAVPDFETGDLLQLTGAAEIVWNAGENETAGAERLWRLRPRRAVRLRDALPLRLGAPEFSPLLALPDGPA